MRAQHTVLWLGLLACHRHAAVHPPVEAPCTTDRVGAVTVTGASRSLVAGLAVLEGTLDDPERTERLVEAATEALRMRGYARARIELTREPGCFVDLHVAVALGPRYRISRIAFDTDDEFPARDRLAVLEDALGTVNTVGGVYIAYRMDRALAELQRRYRDAGWLDARIDAAIARYDRAGEVAITVPVTAGPRFRIARVRARGSDSAARAAVLDELGGHAGAWYDGPTIRSGIERIRRRLDRWVELHTSYAFDGDLVLEAVVGARR